MLLGAVVSLRTAFNRALYENADSVVSLAARCFVCLEARKSAEPPLAFSFREVCWFGHGVVLL
jgi:hypothetical protein